MSDRDTIGVYDRQAGAYAANTDAHNAADPRLTAFIAACPAGGLVLDLGCGPGVAAARMVRHGLRVDAVDASAAMVARAAARPGVTARQASFDEIGGPGTGDGISEAVYDGVWANFSLLHVPRADFPRHLGTLHRGLKPGGALMIGMKLGRGEARDALGRFYSYYSEVELVDFLNAAGFTVTDRAFGRGPGLDGTMSDWISVAAHA